MLCVLWGPCRESAIRVFNQADSPAFIFLLSIRAAGRGLNLQSADTVVIYDPDPNPKNEEQVGRRTHPGRSRLPAQQEALNGFSPAVERASLHPAPAVLSSTCWRSAADPKP